MSTLRPHRWIAPPDNSTGRPGATTEAASTAVQWMARAGYAAKGVVYSIVGVLAVLAAMGERGGQTTGQRGAMATLMSQTGGVALVSVLAAGLSGYALWCLVRAVFDPEHKGADLKGIVQRVAKGVKGLVYAGLVVAAVGMVTGRGEGGGGESNVHRWTGRLMSLPAGRWLAIGTGIGVVVYGLVQVVRAWRVNVERYLTLGEMGPGWRRAVIGISRFGLIARGVVFVGIGVALFNAGKWANPDEAKGVGGSLQWLSGQPYGPWLLGATALGLVASGAVEFVKARYRVIRVPRVGGGGGGRTKAEG